MLLPTPQAHRVQGHRPHHSVLPAGLQLVQVPVSEQEGAVPALVETIHLQDRRLGSLPTQAPPTPALCSPCLTIWS